MKQVRSLVLALAAIALASNALAADPTPIKVKMMALWQAGTVPFKVFEQFAADVKAKSNGRLIIEPLPAGSVVAVAEALDAVTSGVLDAEYGCGGNAAGKEPALALLTDPQGAFDSPEQMAQWMEQGGGLQIAREIYQRFKIHYIGATWYGKESLVSKKPLRGVADFKGLKIRAPVGIGQEIFKRLGAAPVNIPGSEVYTSLERGVVDASDWSTLSMNHELGYHKLAKYPTYPGFHSMGMAEIAINQKKWNTLPDDLKALLETLVKEFSRNLVARIRLDDEKIAQQAKTLGIEPIAWSAAELGKFRAIAREVWALYAARSNMAKKVNESQVAFLKKAGLLD
jgi:TRAP-type mannitol/chloroaromatic compound transport system substrate-binding protein